LIHAISISRQWSAHSLYGYALDHITRQFEDGRIHPAVMLGVAREYGISSLTKPAVKKLAKPEISFASWSTNPNIIRYMTPLDVGTIGWMKEKLVMARIALCTPPPVIHNSTCQHKDHTACLKSWKNFWALAVVPKLLNMDGEMDNSLWWIRMDCVAKASIQGMAGECSRYTIEEVIRNPGWRAETRIPEGAAELLAVEERGMLEPDDILDQVMS